MKSIVKTLFGAACAMMLFIIVSLSTGMPAAADNETSPKRTGQDSTNLPKLFFKPEETRWQMVWVKDLEMHDLPHPDLAEQLNTFISRVNIHTADLDGTPTLTAASANCNFMGRSMMWTIVEPAKTTETIRNGKPHYETKPAIFKKRPASFSTTQKACSFRHEIEGVIYDVGWPNQMEGFLIANINTPINIRAGNILEWEDESGEVIARFEKLPDISMGKIFWKLDPDIHPDDPVLKNYFGPATVSINFPSITSHRGCTRIYAPITLKENKFSLSGGMKSYPCKDLSVLIDGQRTAYTSVANTAEKILETHLPNASQYKVTEEGESSRLVLSDDKGNALINLISTPKRPARNNDNGLRIYDKLGNHEWIMEFDNNDAALKLHSPVRIIRHNAYGQDTTKAYASLISSQGCVLRGFNVNGGSLTMNTYNPFRESGYRYCSGPEALALQKQWASARKILFDDTYLIFYDENWDEVMRAKRGKPVSDDED